MYQCKFKIVKKKTTVISLLPAETQNSERLESPLCTGIPTVQCLLPVLSRTFYPSFPSGARHTTESHLFWEEARLLFPIAKAVTLTLAEPGTPRLHKLFPVSIANVKFSVPVRKRSQRPQLTLVHSRPTLSSSFGAPTAPGDCPRVL